MIEKDAAGRRRTKILYGDGRAVEPEDEPLENISRRLTGMSPPDSARPANLPLEFISKFLERFSPELRRMADARVIEAEVVECRHGAPVVLDMSSGLGRLDEAEPRPPDLRVGKRIWVSILESPASGRVSPSDRPVCSVRLARGRRSLTMIETVWAGKVPIDGVPSEFVPGSGWIVDVDGFWALLPEEESGVQAIQPGVPVRFSVLHYDPTSLCVVLSRKKFLRMDESMKSRWVHRRLSPGQIRDGRIDTVTPTHAVVDLDGMIAFLYGDDAGFGSARDNLSAIQAGQQMKFFVLEVSSEKVVVGIRQLYPDPWVFVKKSVQQGARIEVIVRSILADKVKVELKEGVTGEIPWKEVGWQIEDASEMSACLKPGDRIEASCLSLDRESSKLVLSIKSLLPDPLPEILRKYTPGTRTDVALVGSNESRLRVATDEGYFGWVSPEDLSWSGSINPSHFFAQQTSNKKIQAEVLSVDVSTRLIRFGIKQVRPDPFVILSKEIEAGKAYEGRVVKIISVGALIEIRKGLVGLLRKIDYAPEEQPPAEGQTLKVMVVNIQAQQRRITLSRKSVVELEERSELQPFLVNPQEERKVRMKDVLQGDVFKKFFEKKDQ